MPECKKTKKRKTEDKPSRVDRLIMWLERNRQKIDGLDKGSLESNFAGSKLLIRVIESYTIN